MTGGCEPLRRLFPAGYIPVILLAIHQAGTGIWRESAHEREDWITSRLHKRIICLPVFRDGPLDIRPQPEIPSEEPGDDHAAGRIDLLVSCAQGHDVYFAIEAKRLRVGSSTGRFAPGSSKYVHQGMLRFVNGQYAPRMAAGAMLGYVFDGGILDARRGIGQLIVKLKEKLRLLEPQRLVPSNIVPGQPVDETHHDLKERRFTIYHMFLNVALAPPTGHRSADRSRCC